MLGNAFAPVTLDDSDWGEQLNSTKTVRQTMFSQGHITDKKIGVKMGALLAKGRSAMYLGSNLKLVGLFISYIASLM